MNVCPLDERPSESHNTYHFCSYHSLALNQLREAWVSWQKSLENDIPWEAFLSRIVDLREKDEKLVGVWAFEVARYVLSSK